MSTSNLPNVPSLRRQQLLLDFASLKHAAPPGVYMTLSPGDPALWTGVIFVRSGPYASAILRLQIRFPPSYPDRPPLVTFSTDVFHPLIVPLTTYTFSTGSGVEDPVSAADEGRLPPGGFSLRHGFPHWFKHAKKDTPDATTVTGSMAEQTQAQEVQNIDDDNEKPPRAPTPAHNIPTIPVAELLDYIRSTFDTESILDSLPLEAAGNPGAWHAWRAHRDRRVGRVGFRSASSSAFSSTISTPVSTSKSRHAQSQSPQTRSPGDWHWDGIWANRALDEIKTSRSDVTLFGGMGRGGNGSGSGFSGDDMIRFSRLDDATLASIKEMMIPQIKEKGS